MTASRPDTLSRHRVGEATVTRVYEADIETFTTGYLFPDWEPAFAQRQRAAGLPQVLESADQPALLSVHSWLVKTPDHTILIDTGIGNGKPRTTPAFDRLDTPYLKRLAAAGARPEDIDHVLITHLHTDHVGWNTRLEGERWVPTFPRAKIHFAAAAAAWFREPEAPSRPGFALWQDSVLPVIEAGQVEFVGDAGGAVLPGLRFHPTPGHSVGHMSITLESAGETALFPGDVVHHPLQLLATGWNSRFCIAPEEARASRLWALGYAADTGATVFSSHFLGSSVGTVERRGEGFGWREV